MAQSRSDVSSAEQEILQKQLVGHRLSRLPVGFSPVPMRLASSLNDIGLGEFFAPEQQGFAACAGELISSAVARFQPCRMTASTKATKRQAPITTCRPFDGRPRRSSIARSYLRVVMTDPDQAVIRPCRKRRA